MSELQGVHAAVSTPRSGQGDIDFGAAFELIDRLCAAGVRGIVLFGALIVTGLRNEKWWVLAGIMAFVILFCFIWPGTIILNFSGIIQQVWWRPTVTIRWSEVSAVERNIAGEIQVFGKQGQRIVFDRFHIDPGRFLAEVRRRSSAFSTL